jgi:hypothetical protein
MSFSDSALKDWSEKVLPLSNFFDEGNKFILIHNIGKRQKGIVFWADSGFEPNLNNYSPGVWKIIRKDGKI